jgi:hypothetical protein
MTNLIPSVVISGPESGSIHQRRRLRSSSDIQDETDVMSSSAHSKASHNAEHSVNNITAAIPPLSKQADSLASMGWSTPFPVNTPAAKLTTNKSPTNASTQVQQHSDELNHTGINSYQQQLQSQADAFSPRISFSSNNGNNSGRQHREVEDEEEYVISHDALREYESNTSDEYRR